ncbi:hypothetical protein JHK84_031239 [Glycine max]|nr:hypothetical protein JHK85_031662 [Glycine max]KAG4994283.1 hypothetical protein JHK86_031110 [Glycine max]KAG5145696.1 hypothetical protein JHK84_031239 [Glycine max]
MQGVEGMQKLGCNAFRNNCNSLAWKQGGVDKCTYFDGIVHDCNILLPHVLFILERRETLFRDSFALCAGGVGLACIWGTSPVLIPYMLLRKGRIVRGETGALVLAIGRVEDGFGWDTFTCGVKVTRKRYERSCSYDHSTYDFSFRHSLHGRISGDDDESQLKSNKGGD